VILFIIIVGSISPASSGNKTIQLGQGEEFLVCGDTWHNGITITTTDYTYINSYLLPGKPGLSGTYIKKNETQTLNVASQEYQYYAYRYGSVYMILPKSKVYKKISTK
jgi:hypothetical protein